MLIVLVCVLTGCALIARQATMAIDLVHGAAGTGNHLAISGVWRI